jgi:AcrR family transcriptional regulator
MGQVAVTTPNRGGRPRDPQVDVRVVEAVMAELAAAPYSRMRMDDVAARAGVAKTTLYRRYPSKLALVRGALSQYLTRFRLLDSPDVEAVLADATQQQVDEFAAGAAGVALSNLCAEATHNPELASVVRQAFSTKRDEFAGLLRRGIATGELRADLDVDLFTDLLLAVFPYRLLVSGEPVPFDLAGRLPRALLDGARAR